MEMAQTHKILNQMATYWGDRATVKRQEFDINLVYDPAEDDFLDELIPLQKHPMFQRYYEEFRTPLLACGWLAYNEKTIDIESQIISPACTDLIYKKIPGSAHEQVRWAAAETLVDEGYHVLMVVNAMRACKQWRGLEKMPVEGFDLTRKMNEAMNAAEEEWQKLLIRLATSIVSEVFISDYLGLLSDAKNIQPLNRMTTAAHKHDELAHSGLFKTFAKEIYAALNEEQKIYLATNLAKPIRWFASKELAVWQGMLEYIGFPNAREIVNDCATEGMSDLSRIDYSELIQLAEEVGILDSTAGREAFVAEGVI